MRDLMEHLLKLILLAAFIKFEIKVYRFITTPMELDTSYTYDYPTIKIFATGVLIGLPLLILGIMKFKK